jgi:ankyrin repeat protein
MRRWPAALLLLLLALLPEAAAADVVPTRPALHWAAANGLVEVAKLLIAQGKSVEEVDDFGNTPLHLAVAYPEMVKLLLDSGANVNARNAFGHTPLHLAVGNRAVVELLINAGADVNAKNDFGKTALDYSMRGGTSPYNLSIVTLLIRSGAL